VLRNSHRHPNALADNELPLTRDAEQDEKNDSEFDAFNSNDENVTLPLYPDKALPVVRMPPIIITKSHFSP
jgi:hypothetical protein